MKSLKPTSIHPLLDSRLAAYAAAGVTLAVPAFAPSAQAAVVNSGPINFVIPNNIDGVYYNFLTGGTGTAAFTGWDWNAYLTNGALTFFWNSAAVGPSGGVAATANGNYLALAPGSVVSSSSLFSAASGGGGTTVATAAYQVTGTEVLGIRFYNEATAATNYGYVVLNTTATNGFPATIASYSYENTGAAITVPVPEPTTNAALGLGALALGAMGVRRWRKAKQVVA